MIRRWWFLPPVLGDSSFTRRALRSSKDTLAKASGKSRNRSVSVGAAQKNLFKSDPKFTPKASAVNPPHRAHRWRATDVLGWIGGNIIFWGGCKRHEKSKPCLILSFIQLFCDPRSQREWHPAVRFIQSEPGSDQQTAQPGPGGVVRQPAPLLRTGSS